MRVTFQDKDCVDKALKLDRELRINGFLVTVSKYRDEDEQKAHNAANVNKVPPLYVCVCVRVCAAHGTPRPRLTHTTHLTKLAKFILPTM